MKFPPTNLVFVPRLLDVSLWRLAAQVINDTCCHYVPLQVHFWISQLFDVRSSAPDAYQLSRLSSISSCLYGWFLGVSLPLI